MNCPSRTDEIPSHPEWNQNPPFLTGDLTTRQDLNGLINTRVIRPESDLLGNGSSDGMEDNEGFSNRPPGKNCQPPKSAENCPFYYRKGE